MTNTREVKVNPPTLPSQIERVGKLEQLIAQTTSQRYDMSAMSLLAHHYPIPRKMP